LSTKLIEQFEIPTTDWKTVDAGKNKIRIRGVALRGDVISLNNRHYVAKELKKATNTWIGKPININHDDTRIVGHLTWMDYDEALDLLTYEGEVNKQPYVDLLRTKSSEIRGVSVQAGYLYNLCPECARHGVERKFYDEPSFRVHMHDEHFIKINPKSEPHGIVGEALSLVLSPEIPGYGGTTIDLAEIQRQRTLRLLETVIKEEKEKETYLSSKLKAPVAIAEKAEITVGTAKPEFNHAKPSEPDHPIIPKKVTEQEHQCPEGETWSETEGKCMPKAVEQEMPPDQSMSCPEGEHWDNEKGACVKDEQAMAQEKLSFNFQPKQSQPKTVTIKESVAIAELKETVRPKLKLGEPFAGYTDFAACVAANQDKENPEAYCGQIKHQVEGEMWLRQQVADVRGKLNELAVEVNKPLSVEADNLDWQPQIQELARSMQAFVEHVNALPSDDVGWKRLKPYDDKPLKEYVGNVQKATETKLSMLTETVNAIKPYDDAPLKEAIANIKPFNDEPLKTQIKELSDNLAGLNGKISELQTKLAETEKTVAEKDALIEKVAGERNKKVEELIKENADLKEAKDKELKDIKETLNSQKTALENALDQQKGNFKGKYVEAKEKQNDKPIIEDPLKEKK
jgi:hypothetical protein